MGKVNKRRLARLFLDDDDPERLDWWFEAWR